MRRSIVTMAAIGMIGLSTPAGTNAAPIEGFEALYEAAFTACTAPDGGSPDADACANAIAVLSTTMAAAGVAPEAIAVSFTELRAEVAVAGGSAVAEALFVELVPQSSPPAAVVGEPGGAPSTPS